MRRATTRCRCRCRCRCRRRRRSAKLCAGRVTWPPETRRGRKQQRWRRVHWRRREDKEGRRTPSPRAAAEAAEAPAASEVGVAACSGDRSTATLAGAAARSAAGGHTEGAEEEEEEAAEAKGVKGESAWRQQ